MLIGRLLDNLHHEKSFHAHIESDNVASGSHSLLTIMNAYVVYNSEHKVLICKEHEYALSLKSIVSHFREEHDIPLQARQEIFQYATKAQIAEPEDLVYSNDKVGVIPYLKIIQGYRCEYESCNLILGTIHSIKKHCKLEHEWKTKDGICWVEIRAQTFYQGNSRR